MGMDILELPTDCLYWAFGGSSLLSLLRSGGGRGSYLNQSSTQHIVDPVDKARRLPGGFLYNTTSLPDSEFQRHVKPLSIWPTSNTT